MSFLSYTVISFFTKNLTKCNNECMNVSFVLDSALQWKSSKDPFVQQKLSLSSFQLSTTIYLKWKRMSRLWEKFNKISIHHSIFFICTDAAITFIEQSCISALQKQYIDTCSDWSVEVTWPEFWPLIGQQYSDTCAPWGIVGPL